MCITQIVGFKLRTNIARMTGWVCFRNLPKVCLNALPTRPSHGEAELFTALRKFAPGLAGWSTAPESGAKDTRSPDASQLPDAFKPRKASGLRRVHRRFLRAPGFAGRSAEKPETCKRCSFSPGEKVRLRAGVKHKPNFAGKVRLNDHPHPGPLLPGEVEYVRRLLEIRTTEFAGTSSAKPNPTICLNVKFV